MTTPPERYTAEQMLRFAESFDLINDSGLAAGMTVAKMLRQAASDARYAERYAWIRSKQDGSARKGERAATVIFWGDEPYEPNTGADLDLAIDTAMGERDE